MDYRPPADDEILDFELPDEPIELAPVTMADRAAIMLLFDIPVERYSFRGKTPEAFHTRQLERVQDASDQEDATRILAETRPPAYYVNRERKVYREMLAQQEAADAARAREAAPTEPPLLATDQFSDNALEVESVPANESIPSGLPSQDEKIAHLSGVSHPSATATLSDVSPRAVRRRERDLQRARMEGGRHLTDAAAAIARARSAFATSDHPVLRQLDHVLGDLVVAVHSESRRVHNA